MSAFYPCGTLSGYALGETRLDEKCGIQGELPAFREWAKIFAAVLDMTCRSKDYVGLIALQAESCR